MHRYWFEFINGYAQVLEAGYQLAKQFEHKTLIGDVREYFVNMFLLKILPETMGIGSGEIIDRNGSRSDEIDTIIYNKNFPVLKVTDGKSIFPIEAVVATIEIKSTLEGGELKKALDNCKSVTDLCPSVQNNTTIMEQIKVGGIAVEWAYPATYIFGYRHYSENASTFTDAVEKWADSYNFKSDISSLGLLSYPTMAVTEGCLSIRASERLKVEVSEKYEIAFAAIKTEVRIHVFICDLLETITRRSFLNHPLIPYGRFGMEAYFDTAKLIQEKIGIDAKWDYICRKFI